MTKKIIFSFVGAIVIILIVAFIIFKKDLSTQSFTKNNFSNKGTELSTEEKEENINKALAKKFSLNEEDLSILVARDSDSFINGIFFIEGSDNFKAYFLAESKKNINIIWADEDLPSCSLLSSYQIPREMMEHCF